MSSETINPWDYKTSEVRNEDTVSTFIIFCEDEVSEARYFESFQSAKLKVNVVGGQKSGYKNVTKAITHCIDEKYFIEGDIINTAGGLNVWCVFDRDKGTDNKTECDVEFDESIETATKHNIHVAWSNDCFELWVVMHFFDVNDNMKERDGYYSLLTKYFKSIENPCEQLQKALSHASFCYKKDMKSNRNFTQILLPILKNDKLMANALIKAENLDGKYDASLKPHEMCPCTKVYLLVKELLANR